MTKLTDERLTAALLALHDPLAKTIEHSHVVSTWKDGEVSMTKCGSLYGARIEHCIEWAQSGTPLPVTCFSEHGKDHGRIQTTYENYKPARDFVLEQFRARSLQLT